MEPDLQNRISEIEMEIEALKKKLYLEGRRKERILEIVRDLRGGRKVTDFRFDMIYPISIRKLSETHWTPVEVAIRAAEFLVKDGRTRVLDVGSGCGKFCVIAALSCPGQFVGVEQRPHLVAVAKKTIEELEVKNGSILEGNMTDLDWTCFNAVYLYNPFYEHKIKAIRMDETLSFNHDKFIRYVETVRSKLGLALPGTRAVTYHGFGGDMPEGYYCLKKEPIGTGYLELWEKMEEPQLKFEMGE